MVETFHGSTSSRANWHHPQLHRHGKDLGKRFVCRFRRLGRMSSEKTKTLEKISDIKKKSLCNMHHFSLGISLFLSLFNQKKSLAPSPSRFLLGLGIGENSCPPQKKHQNSTEVDEKRCCFDRVFVGKTAFLFGLPLF